MFGSISQWDGDIFDHFNRLEREMADLLDFIIAYLIVRFTGLFILSLSLPEDIDPESATARYTNGVLHISLKRRAEAKPRKIQVN
mgnify:CR=1 FL=1